MGPGGPCGGLWASLWGLGVLFAPLGRSLGRLDGPLGSCWVHVARFGRHVGSLRGSLGCFWELLGVVMAPFLRKGRKRKTIEFHWF